MKTLMVAGDRKDRLIHERVHDPYKFKHKLPEPCVCPVCHAIFRDGRWQWAESWPVGSHRELCQACQRVRDKFPAGVVTLRGGFVSEHKDEILNLARNLEQGEKEEHPLHRIMKIEARSAAIHIETTDIHLPRRIGEALRRAYKGELALRYGQDGCFVRVNWNREQPATRKKRLCRSTNISAATARKSSARF